MTPHEVAEKDTSQISDDSLMPAGNRLFLNSFDYYDYGQGIGLVNQQQPQYVQTGKVIRKDTLG